MTTEGRALLEVACLHARDVRGCVEGGADRLLYGVPGPDGGLVSPDPASVSALVRATDLPVRVVLRAPGSPAAASPTGGGFVRLVERARELLSLGAEGVVFGFLDADLEVDAETCAALARALPGVPWTFPATFDQALEPRRAWRAVLGLPGLSAVATAGSPQGLDHGYDDLLALLDAVPAVAPLVMAAGGLRADHVPWLVRAGVRQFRLDTQARPGGSTKAYVDAEFVRSWRVLLDAETARTRSATA